MNRKQFLHQCGLACIGAVSLSVIGQSCTTSRQLNAVIDSDNRMLIPLKAFTNSTAGTNSSYKRYVVVQNDRLNYPIVVYRNGEKSYTALLLRCSHQYNELNVSGELLTCPAHGSEFNTRGEVVNGPAEDKLRSFTVTVDDQNLYIHLA